ncbi:MAG: biotin/lipoyl-binding protein [Chromatiaceae bacterium]|nr:biotin/lipoyl-binding protein [Chromatiaceae bacterium]
MSKLLKILLPLLILAAGLAVFMLLEDTRPEQKAAEIQERIWRIEVETAEPRSLAPEIALYGQVQTPDLLKLAASAQARVAEVAVRDGDRVETGQLLVRLDERDFLPGLHQAQAEVAELQAEILSEKTRFERDRKASEQEQTLLSIARDGVKRAQRLTKQRVGSETDLDKAEETLARQALAVSIREMDIEDHPARLRALEARLSSTRARLADVELDFERARVTAPFDGVVAGVAVTAGDQVKQDAELVRLYSLDRLEVRARIPAPFQAEVSGALASGTLLNAYADVGDVQIPLRLDRVAGEAQPSGVDGLFAVERDAQLLRLGQMLSLRLVLPPRSDAVALPFQAVYGGGRIYKLVDGRLRGIRVESLGGISDGNGGERLLVRSPELVAGDRIVVTHMPNAIDGLRVDAIQ